jgi:cell division control protein 6
MLNTNNNLKRSFEKFINEDELIENDLELKELQLLKKHKSNILQNSNKLGLISPPVTPEKFDKTINISNLSLKSISKNLNNNLLSTSSSSSSCPISQLKLKSPYTNAKNLFLKSSNPYSTSNFILNGRENEAKILNSYIIDSIKNLKSTSIYISGPPGTGKSAQTNATLSYLISNSKIIDENKKIYKIEKINNQLINKKIKIIKFNCMSLNNSNDLFKNLYNEISNNKINSKNITSNELFNLLINSNKNNYDMTILILDEMDNIIQKSQQSLFELFTWASNLLNIEIRPNLLLIGIANALNLTDRFLPRLRSNCISPKILQFLPYTADQIKSVITNKLFTLISLNNIDNNNNKENQLININNSLPPLVHPAAIKFCAKKSAITTGDLRRSFDIMFKSLDLFEKNLLKTISINDLLKIPIEKLPKMMISQVVKVCSDSFNANFDCKINPLTIQQKMILTFLFKFEEKIETESNKFIKSKTQPTFNTLDSFFKYYIQQCKNLDYITLLKRSEFLEIISFLDVHGLLIISMVNTSSSTKNLIANNVASLNFDNFKVTTNIPKSEYFKHVNDILILKKIIYSKY